MKSITKKHLIKLTSLTFISLFTYIAVFTFDSSCACEPPIVAFAVYIGVAPIDLNLETVKAGFVKKYPKGSKVDIKRLSDQGEDREINKKENFIEFDIWLESNLVAKRGYRISFVLNDNNVETVDVQKISSWFGHKTIDSKPTEKIACK